MRDYILEFSFEELRKNAPPEKLKIFSCTPIVSFCGDIKLTEEQFCDLLKTQNFKMLELIFRGVKDETQKSFVKHFLKNIDLIPKRLLAWNNKKAQIKAYKHNFFTELLRIAEEKDFEEAVSILLDRFEVPDRAIVSMAKKFKDNSKILQSLYSGASKDSLKAKLLKYMPSAAVALSEKNVELRDKAKQNLGLIKKVTNYKHEIRTAFRKVLEDNFNGTLEKGQTANLRFTNKSSRIRNFGIEWRRQTEIGSVYDESNLYFRIFYHNKTDSRWSYPRAIQANFFEGHSAIKCLNTWSGNYFVAKTEYKKLIDWINTELVSVVEEVSELTSKKKKEKNKN